MQLSTLLAGVVICFGAISHTPYTEAIQCMCNAWGDPHYVSFDRVTTHFQGRCKYILVMPQSNKVKRNDPCYFRIEAQNKWWPRHVAHSKVTAILWADLFIFGHVFRLGQGGALWADKRRIHSRAIREPGMLSIRPSGRNLIISAPKCKLRITWNGLYTLKTYLLGHKWRNKVKGLCGNCNGNRGDERMTRDGAVVKNINEFGNSYLVGSDRKVDHRCPATVSRGRHPCHRRYRKYVKRMTYCGAMYSLKRGPFSKCLSDLKVNAKQRFLSCRMDVCMSAKKRGGGGGGSRTQRARKNMKQSACQALRNLEQRCEELDLKYDDDWEDQTGCKIRCPAGMTYQHNVRPCPATCQQRNTRRCRFQKRTHACRCPNGMLQEGRRCVRADQCPSGKKGKRGGETDSMHLMFLKFMKAMKNGKGMPKNLVGVPKKHKRGPQFNWNQNGKQKGGVKIPNFNFNFNMGGRKKKQHTGVVFTVQRTPFLRLDNGELLMIIQQGRSYLFPAARLTNFGTRIGAGGVVKVIPGMHSSVIGKALIRIQGNLRVVNCNTMRVIVSPKFRMSQLVRIPGKEVVGKGRIVSLPGNKRVVVRIDHQQGNRPRHIIQLVTPIQKVRQPVVRQTVHIVHHKVVVKRGGQSRIDHAAELIVDRRGKEFVPLGRHEFIEVIEEVHGKKK